MTTLTHDDNTPERKTEIYIPELLEVDGQLISHNVWVGKHRTNIRLEAVMWATLREIAVRENLTIHEVITVVAKKRNPNASLTATIRAFLIAYYRGMHLLRDKGLLPDQQMSLLSFLDRTMFKA